MNKSYSKIRHIQESNLRLEKRLMSEQTDEERRTKSLDDHYVSPLINAGYKEVPKASLPDGQYAKQGGGYSINLYDKDNKTDTGYVFVMKNGIRGQWNGQLINIKDGTIPFPAELLAPPYHEGVYKIFYKPVESAVSNQTPNTH